MKATAHLQIIPLYPNGDPNKLPTGARIDKVTKNAPRIPEPGALVVRIEVDVDPAVWEVPTIKVELDGDPQTVAAAVAPVPVPVAEEEDDGRTGPWVS